MCGLAGVIALNGGRVDPIAVKRMADSLRHRGPDDEGILVQGAVGFGFRRLAILDLSPSGHQPMVSQDGRYVLVYNGEIYNYIELRRELQAQGYQFRSSGDTEVLLNAYDAWGTDCLHKFNGMWAFLIYDTHKKIIFGSRDRFGIKPLYRYRARNLVLFASEIKAILSSGHYCEGTNWNVASRFLVEGRLDTTDETFFDGITRVPARSAFELDLHGNYKEWKYWSLSDLPAIECKDPPAEFAELFEDAVRLRMRSDVPVGVLLSGGLDSTSIICSMSKLKKTINGDATPLWAISYMAHEFDESTYIRDTLTQTDADLVPIEIKPTEMIARLAKFLWHHDEPVHTMTAMIGYELLALASRNGVKVILSGQGADETIAGYPGYFPDYWKTILHFEGFSALKREIEAYTQIGRAHV